MQSHIVYPFNSNVARNGTYNFENLYSHTCTNITTQLICAFQSNVYNSLAINFITVETYTARLLHDVGNPLQAFNKLFRQTIVFNTYPFTHESIKRQNGGNSRHEKYIHAFSSSNINAQHANKKREKQASRRSQWRKHIAQNNTQITFLFSFCSLVNRRI